LRRPGTLAAIASVITVIAVCAAGCGSEKAAPSASGARSQGASAEVASLLAGIPQHGSTLGDRKAPVVVQFFGDLECPYCRRFALGPLRPLIERYVRAGRLKIEYRSLQTATHDPDTFRTQQVAALAAGRQNRMWNFIELFYHEQRKENSGYVTEGFLQGLAQQVGGLNLIAWTAARNDTGLAATVTADSQAASGAEINSTPAFRVGAARHVAYLSAIKKLLTS
jgi:protein-disulfide isomerase